MTGAAQKLLDEALDLPEEDRRKLAEVLLASVDRGEEIELAWTNEAKRRAELVEEGKAATLDGEKAVSQLEAKLRNFRHNL